ncbi:unnamed protein product [Ectocarpus fasciculatus]
MAFERVRTPPNVVCEGRVFPPFHIISLVLGRLLALFRVNPPNSHTHPLLPRFKAFKLCMKQRQASADGHPVQKMTTRTTYERTLKNKIPRVVHAAFMHAFFIPGSRASSIIPQDVSPSPCCVVATLLPRSTYVSQGGSGSNNQPFSRGRSPRTFFSGTQTTTSAWRASTQLSTALVSYPKPPHRETSFAGGAACCSPPRQRYGSRYNAVPRFRNGYNLLCCCRCSSPKLSYAPATTTTTTTTRPLPLVIFSGPVQ